MVTLSPNARRATMQQNNALVARIGKLWARKHELLNNITKLQKDALQVSEKVFTTEARVDTLLKESREIFLNGTTPLESMQDIIEKVEETRKAVNDVKKNFINFVNIV